MFRQYISVDWSGEGRDDKRVNLRVICADESGGAQSVAPPRSPRQGVRSWKRADVVPWLAERLKRGQPRCLVAMDFGFGFPWRADGEVFHAAGWRDMLCKVHGLYEKHRTARAVAAAINAEVRFAGHGPFRFNDNRTDWQFHSSRSVAY